MSIIRRALFRIAALINRTHLKCVSFKIASKSLVGSPFRGKEVSSSSKTHLISMVRNEIDLIEDFVSHVTSLFDRVIIIDHLSEDGTREYLRQLEGIVPNLEVFSLDMGGFYKSQVLTAVTRSLIAKKSDGWVFYLDADEFLAFETKQEFRSALAAISRHPVVSMKWINCVPVEFNDSRVLGREYYIPSVKASIEKIAFQPRHLPYSDFYISQGQHSINYGKKYQFSSASHEVFNLLHFPVRSLQQIVSKTTVVRNSYLSMNNRNPRHGRHLNGIWGMIESNDLTHEKLIEMAAGYGEPESHVAPKTKDDLLALGYAIEKVELSSQVMPLHATDFADNKGGKRYAEQSMPTRKITELDWINFKIDLINKCISFHSN